MSQPDIFDPARLVLSQPICPQCGARMWLAQIEPDEPGHDKRTFECPRCENVVNEIVKYR
jgi:ribosomal protein S27AE